MDLRASLSLSLSLSLIACRHDILNTAYCTASHVVTFNCITREMWINLELGNLCHRSTAWLGSSVVRVLARYARGPAFEFRSGHVLFPPVWHLVASVGVHARAASSKGTVSSVPAWFWADSGTNLIKQGEIVTDRPCGSVAQWSECLHGMREVLGSSPGRAMCFFLPCDICTWLVKWSTLIKMFSGPAA